MVEAVVCPSCGRRSKVEPELLGQEGRCAGCGTIFTLAVPEPTYGRDGKIKLQCPRCGTKYRLRPELAGRQVMCTSCRSKMPVPGRRSGGPTPVSSRRGPRASSVPTQDRDLYRLIEFDDEDDGDLSTVVEPSRSTGLPDRPRPSPDRRSRERRGDDGTWKWWYFVVAGALIVAFSVWQLLEGEPILQIGGRRRGPVGGLILGTLSILIGLWSRPGREDAS
jgi:hypothetical protein